ncbi:RB1-inducible coiled-coil protein 1 [Teleopsis dalmanni]|uniref:RB1-inducible coiled-coil protein 1 n=1 Tax=Teleopsis dalmanni TaxID=139649 RepID=UPI0018CE6A53|nr:RB1-inducible coiled-coil protein 1 [Teleopsis dalmanni]
MMLYVFHVDVGRMMNFDMTVALSSVENLKDTIERLHGIPAANIVLLVSGGEMLTQSTQVSFYSAGTDTNPIYMFLTGETRLPPSIAQSEPDIDLREQVERCLELPAVYETVVTRAQLALRMHDMARDEERLCERLVHEQHLQQQGWSAVVANMEDLTDEFRLRFHNFCKAFDQHLEKRSRYFELLHNFGDDLTKLARIPILPGLMQLAEEDFHGFDELLDNDEVFTRSNEQQQSVLIAGETIAAKSADDTNTQDDGKANEDDKNTSSTNKKLKLGNDTVEEGASATSQNSNNSSRRNNFNLLQWITSKENHNTLKLMSDECEQGLGTFNENVYEKLKLEVQNIIKLADQVDVKEIKGLGERLCKLEEFKYKVKAMVQDQRELSTAFQQNQNRAMNLRDASILPDLCASHQSQLRVMLQNHQKIRDHRRCIAKAKDELGTNLHTRLKRIVWIENGMSEFDNRLLFYHRCLRRAEKHIHIIEQIHQAPSIYVAAVAEVVRRKIFSGEFRMWASKLAEDFDTIHSEEIKRREMFNASFEGHFLNILFPGMSDMPPAFANEHPLIFDARLPNITKSDIDMLSSHLPDLAPQIQLPDMGPVINFFVSRSGEHQKTRLEELLRQQVEAVLGNASLEAVTDKPAQHQRLSELQKEAGCDESETDTETEFEKVLATVQTVATSTSENQNPETISKSTATDHLVMQSAETLTDENESETRAELTRLHGILNTLAKLSTDCLCLARVNIESIRSDTATYRDNIQEKLLLLNNNCTLMVKQCEAEEKEKLEISAERERELQQLREKMQQKDTELELMQEQKIEAKDLEIKCATLEAQVEELQDQLKLAQTEKENVIHEHKNEIESLRCRFKLMTSMDRSPSDTSLEKLERPVSAIDFEQNVIDLVQHKALMVQLRTELELEKEKAISAAIEGERTIWQSVNSESVMVNVGILKEMIADKERQVEQLREKDLLLTKENYQLKTRIEALVNEEGNSWLKEKIEYLNRDKTRLEKELNKEKSRRLDMESSIAAVQSTDQGSLPRSKSSGSSHRYIVLDSCNKGDIVFIIWNMRHGQFVVVQESQYLYFVHGDSLVGLNLRIPNAQTDNSDDNENRIPVPYYAIGRVIDKEFCQARKEENRYRVSRGSKFYRIKVAPLTTKPATRRERLETFSTSISRSISQCESQCEPSVAAPGQQAVSSTTTQQNAPLSFIGADTALTATTVIGDVVDAIVTSAFATVSPTITTANPVDGDAATRDLKTRTISVTSVTEEDDEPVSLLSEHCRYISVSEEDEPVDSTTNQQQQSVITEQPTPSNKIMNLLLAIADTYTSTSAASTDTSQVVIATAPSTTAAITIPTDIAPDTTSSHSIPTSIGTTSEDSDEYRSLEGKDDTEYAIFE